MKNYHVGQILLGVLLMNFRPGVTTSENDTRRTFPSLTYDSVILQRSVLLRTIRSASVQRNVSESVVKKPQVISYSIARRPGPAKRDFMDHNPPKTPEELYSRYDPSVAVSTGVALGGLLCFIIGRVMLRTVIKFSKRQLRKTKRFAKYFPERELPPLHVAQQIAREHGIALPESLILKLVRAGPDANLKYIADCSKSPAAIAAAAISPLILQQNVEQSTDATTGQPTDQQIQSPSASELLGLIRVNVIGATPSITPNTSHKLLPELAAPEKPTGETGIQPKPAAVHKSKSAGKAKSKHDEGAKTAEVDSRMKNSLVVTRATIETKPLLHSTTSTNTLTASSGKNASFSGGLNRSRNSSANFSNNLSTGTKISTESRLPAVHRSMSGRTVSTSSYCLTNGGAVMNSGALDRRKLMED